MTEYIGYLASFFIMSSFLMKDIKKLRVINCLGCASFVAYGFMLQTSWPIIITNAFILVTNFYYLFFAKSEQS